MSKKVFLSFSLKDQPLVNLLRKQLSIEGPTLQFDDLTSIESGEEWKKVVEDKIKSSSSVICILGYNTWESDPVKWEVEEALKQGKKVIAIKLKPTVFLFPNVITDNKIKVLDWDFSKIMQEIK
jgi:hypothetical protein